MSQVVIKPWKSLFEGGKLKDQISFAESLEIKPQGYYAKAGGKKSVERPAIKPGVEDAGIHAEGERATAKGQKAEITGVKGGTKEMPKAKGERAGKPYGDKVKTRGPVSSMDNKETKLAFGDNMKHASGDAPKIEKRKETKPVIKEEHEADFSMNPEEEEFSHEKDLGVGHEDEEGNFMDGEIPAESEFGEDGSIMSDQDGKEGGEESGPEMGNEEVISYLKGLSKEELEELLDEVEEDESEEKEEDESEKDEEKEEGSEEDESESEEKSEKKPAWDED